MFWEKKELQNDSKGKKGTFPNLLVAFIGQLTRFV